IIHVGIFGSGRFGRTTIRGQGSSRQRVVDFSVASSICGVLPVGVQSIGGDNLLVKGGLFHVRQHTCSPADPVTDKCSRRKGTIGVMVIVGGQCQLFQIIFTLRSPG